MQGLWSGVSGNSHIYNDIYIYIFTCTYSSSYVNKYEVSGMGAFYSMESDMHRSCR